MLVCSDLNWAVLYCAVLCCVDLICTALYYTVPHCTALILSPLYCTTLPCPALHCTALHWFFSSCCRCVLCWTPSIWYSAISPSISLHHLPSYHPIISSLPPIPSSHSILQSINIDIYINTRIHQGTTTTSSSSSSSSSSSAGGLDTGRGWNGGQDRGLDNLGCDDTLLLLDRMKDLTSRTLHLEVLRFLALSHSLTLSVSLSLSLPPSSLSPSFLSPSSLPLSLLPSSHFPMTLSPSPHDHLPHS